MHSETSTYTLDFRLPVNYPEMRPVTDYIAQRGDDFADWLKQYPVPGGTHSGLDIVGRSYESSSTQSLVLDVHTEGGVHPVTTFKAFNCDVGKRAPITLDTLFKPGAQPQEVLAGAGPCTKTGYPGVDSGAGGPLLHAQRTPRGYMGGLPSGVDEPPTITLGPSVQAHAVAEGLAATRVETNVPPTPICRSVPRAQPKHKPCQ